jgi:hypothetical protein
VIYAHLQLLDADLVTEDCLKWAPASGISKLAGRVKGDMDLDRVVN